MKMLSKKILANDKLSKDMIANINAKIIVFIFQMVLSTLTLGLVLMSPSATNAQCAVGCFSNADCENSCGVEWFCSSGECCSCVYGPGTFGPRVCGTDPSEASVYGCAPDPGGGGPTNPPAATPTPVCCSGSPGCGNWSSDYDNCTGYSCNWNPACPGPTSVGSVWVCQRPGSVDPDNICGQVQLSCPNPDVDGALCFTTQATCISNCHPYPTNPITPRPPLASLCYYAAGRIGIYTAVGCVPTDNNNELIAFVLRWSLGVGGGITFLLIVYSGFMIMTSGGNTEKTKAGKELLTAAITGLMILIFSVFILDFFGLRILRIPGL